MKIDNIEDYEYSILTQFLFTYRDKLIKSKGVDPDFPGVKLNIK